MFIEATIKTAIPTTSGFRNFAFCNLIFAFSLLHLYNCKESSTNQLFYAKQTQFAESPNERNLFNNSRI
jgi:hypothetical protein